MKTHKQTAKFIVLLLLMLCSITSFAAEASDLLIQDIPVNRQVKPVGYKGPGPIMAGAGFSHDTQQVAPNLCYDVKELAHTEQQGAAVINHAVSFEDLEKQLHTKVSASGHYGMFSADADAEYLRTVQDLKYSLSLNYYQYSYNNVKLGLKGTGQNILNSFGKEIYTDPNTKQNFGILCGDDFISSYQQGALLLMSINIRFASHYDKEEFNAKAGASWGNIGQASAEIQRIATQYNMKGTVIIQAFQKGGRPQELSKILTDDKGVYYALSCDIKHMDNCVKAASGLMDYAVKNFSSQISFSPEEKNLTPLGTGFMHHDPISEYGLLPPPSLVTPQVEADRKKLGELLIENKYYQERFNEFLFAYPVPLDKASPIYTQAQKLYIQSTNNIDAIVNPQNPDDGGLKCFNHPTECYKTLTKIQENIQPITPQLGFLGGMNKKVRLTYYYNELYYPNDQNQYVVWDARYGWRTGTINLLLPNINVNVKVPFNVPGPGGRHWELVDAKGILVGTDVTDTYAGMVGWHWGAYGDGFNMNATFSTNDFTVLPFQP